MHGAGFQGRADIAKILIDHGVRCVPFLRKWPNGAHIPSHFSCKRCASLIAGGVLRLRQGPRGSVDDKHSDGHHPIVRACWGREQRHTDTVRVMLEGGATRRGLRCHSVLSCMDPKVLGSLRIKQHGARKNDRAVLIQVPRSGAARRR